MRTSEEGSLWTERERERKKELSTREKVSFQTCPDPLISTQLSTSKITASDGLNLPLYRCFPLGSVETLDRARNFEN